MKPFFTAEDLMPAIDTGSDNSDSLIYPVIVSIIERCSELANAKIEREGKFIYLDREDRKWEDVVEASYGHTHKALMLPPEPIE